MSAIIVRNDWDYDGIRAIFEQPINDLLFAAHQIHRQAFEPNSVQMCTIVNIKKGACPEDCGYCAQSAHYKVDLKKERLMSVEKMLEEAKLAKANGATRCCLGAAWRNPTDRDMPQLIAMIKALKDLGMEACVTAGMLTADQAQAMREAGLDYYNHNLDTSPEYYKKIISTRTYQDRLNTLTHVRSAGINVCCGGIIGMGETRADRIGLLLQLANLPEHPQSVPINLLEHIVGTPLGDIPPLDPFELVRSVATARILMPYAMVRLSAGRNSMSDELQALCFFAGANSIHYGEKLLVVDNPKVEQDQALLQRLGIQAVVSKNEYAE